MNPNKWDEPDEPEMWLVSYADMMTLIACFFILMMAFANYEPVGFQKKSKEIAKHFRKDKYKSAEVKMKYIEEEVAIHPELKNKAKVSIKDGELQLVFSGSALFENNSYQLDESTIKTVDALIDIIKTTNSQYRILVEGHADDRSTGETQYSSWALSGLRAASIIDRFAYYGFQPQNLRAVGLGDTQKLVPSIDDKGQFNEKNARINRRAIIKVLEPIAKKQVKMGLGVYFEDSVDNPKEMQDMDEAVQKKSP